MSLANIGESDSSIIRLFLLIIIAIFISLRKKKHGNVFILITCDFLVSYVQHHFSLCVGSDDSPGPCSTELYLPIIIIKWNQIQFNCYYQLFRIYHWICLFLPNIRWCIILKKIWNVFIILVTCNVLVHKSISYLSSNHMMFWGHTLLGYIHQILSHETQYNLGDIINFWRYIDILTHH